MPKICRLAVCRINTTTGRGNVAQELHTETFIRVQTIDVQSCTEYLVEVFLFRPVILRMSAYNEAQIVAVTLEGWVYRSDNGGASWR